MKTLSLSAHAKLNLTLDITGVREDGYHLLRSVMHTVALHDRVTVTAGPAGETGVSLTADKPFIPTDGRNTAVQAAGAFCRAAGLALEVRIRIQKRIPVGAGLGGGSADAAAVLHALDRLTGARLGTERLCEIGLGVGADVPFCVLGGAAEAAGIGEKLEPLPCLPQMPVVLVKPRLGVSTPLVYREFDRTGPGKKPDNDRAVRALREGNAAELCRACGNVLMPAAAAIRPEIPGLCERLRALGAAAAEMTGSGAAVFGLFFREEDAAAAARELRGGRETVILTRL